jgi:hypothetical protein
LIAKEWPGAKRPDDRVARRCDRVREDVIPSTVLVDIAGRRRHGRPCPLSTLGGRHDKGLRHPADPPSVQEIIAVIHAAGENADGVRLPA